MNWSLKVKMNTKIPPFLLFRKLDINHLLFEKNFSNFYHIEPTLN
ncbi:hypothetical protein LEP1GSC049_3042 [Leptospira kirschneri serovar Cynopteri str. 3522 CT]|nr:hypothetical protein LEP1GSC049_3042 [Leptospira kirschneri serovar Cynopteri str. 3522 CT]